MGSNGLNVDRQGRLLLCQHGDRRVARLDPPSIAAAAKYRTVADRYDGKRFNSPNDLVVHSSGAIYFTDPPYGLEQQMDDPAKELSVPGRLSHRARRQSDAAHQGDGTTQRHRLLAR